MHKCKRIVAAGSVWALMSVPAHAEMHKSGASMGSVLWGVILLAVGVPLGIGLLAQVLVTNATDKRPSRAATLFMAFISWWGGMFLAMGSHETGQSNSGTTLLLFLGTLALTTGMAYLSATPAAPDEE
ncbi:hypothetical protein [Hymenobacter sp. UYP22]|uniref:hypothetical protein n=1 Tax=Hymenobacter sp. UYP22 TaxID=3156348 RepID=UPI00339A1232